MVKGEPRAVGEERRRGGLMTCQGDCALGKKYANTGSPRGSSYTTIGELGPQIPYYRRNDGSQFPIMVVYVDPLGHNPSESLKHYCSTYGSDQVVQSFLHSSY